MAHVQAAAKTESAIPARRSQRRGIRVNSRKQRVSDLEKLIESRRTSSKGYSRSSHINGAAMVDALGLEGFNYLCWINTSRRC